jgi:hypothetical protein
VTTSKRRLLAILVSMLKSGTPYRSLPHVVALRVFALDLPYGN